MGPCKVYHKDSEFSTDLCVCPSLVVTNLYLQLFQFSPSERYINRLQLQISPCSSFICSRCYILWRVCLYFLFYMIF